MRSSASAAPRRFCTDVAARARFGMPRAAGFSTSLYRSPTSHRTPGALVTRTSVVKRRCAGQLGQRDVRRVVRARVVTKRPHAWPEPVGRVADDRELREAVRGCQGLLVGERARAARGHAGRARPRCRADAGPRRPPPRAGRGRARRRRSRPHRRGSIASSVVQFGQDRVAIDASADLPLGASHDRRVVAHSL